jgi:hypothetical protein
VLWLRGGDFREIGMVVVRGIGVWTAVIWALWWWPGPTLVCLAVIVAVLVLVAIWRVDREDAAGIARVQGRRR